MKIYTGRTDVTIEASKREVALLTLGLRIWLQMSGVVFGEKSNDYQVGIEMLKELEIYLRDRRLKDETRTVDSDNLRKARADGEGVPTEDGGSVPKRERGNSVGKEDGGGRQDRGDGGGSPSGAANGKG